jgi:hypothetical protein
MFLPPIHDVALSFLNDMRWWHMILNGKKNVELRVWRKGDPERSDRYTHVILRMVARLRNMKGLKHLNLKNINIIARLGERLGPYDNAKEAIRVAEDKGWKIGMDEAELTQFMKGIRKVKGGSSKGGYEEEYQRSVMLYRLGQVQETLHYRVHDSYHNQAGFLPHQFKDKHSHNMIDHFQYRLPGPGDVAAVLNTMDQPGVESTSVSGPPTVGATPAVCVPAAAPAVVPTVAKPSVMGVKRCTATNGRFRLGKAPSSAVVSAPVVRDAVRIPRKRSRCEEIVIE